MKTSAAKSGRSVRIATRLAPPYFTSQLPVSRCHEQNAGLYPARELRTSIPIHNTIHLLDPLAHVTVVLDSRLCLSPVGGLAPRDVVAKFRTDRFDGPVRTVA